MNKDAIDNVLEFMKKFNDSGSYRVWCHTQTSWDLKKHLKALEVEEIYDACAIARDVIKAKDGAYLLSTRPQIIYPTKNREDEKS